MISVYYMKLDGDCSKEQSLALYRMLPQERQESVKRAKSEAVARKRLYTGAFLQCVLSKETGVPIEQLQYEYNQWGKPELAKGCLDTMSGELNNTEKSTEEMTGRKVHFNLSHSGDYATLAVSDYPIGIDIEHKSKNYLSLAERCFCKVEYEDILSAGTEEEQKRRFLEYWTMKEAYVKCVGEGLRIPLNSFLIERGEDRTSIRDKQICLNTFFLEENYCVSVCGTQVENLGHLVLVQVDDTRCGFTMTNHVIPM